VWPVEEKQEPGVKVANFLKVGNLFEIYQCTRKGCQSSEGRQSCTSWQFLNEYEEEKRNFMATTEKTGS